MATRERKDQPPEAISTWRLLLIAGAAAMKAFVRCFLVAGFLLLLLGGQLTSTPFWLWALGGVAALVSWWLVGRIATWALRAAGETAREDPAGTGGSGA